MANGGRLVAIDRTNDDDFLRDRPQILWHPDLHRHEVHEHLVFISIGFHPRYDREAALEIVERATSEVGVRSYVVWELHRKPDLLLMVWIPGGEVADDLWVALRHEARTHPALRFDLSDTTFHVSSILEHHLWPRSLGETEIVEALELGGDFLVSGHAGGTIDREMESLIRRKIASAIEPEPAGIKWFVWLSVSELVANERARTLVDSELRTALTQTTKLFASSIYSGTSDTNATYLITGRVRPEHYEALATELQPRLAAIGDPFIATNTDTSLSSLLSPIHMVEGLLASAPGGASETGLVDQKNPPVDLEVLLVSDESDVLEFKGSAFTPIVRPNDDLRSNDRALKNLESLTKAAIVKTCVGFLNSSGGVLVIGVLEGDKFTLADAKSYSPEAVSLGSLIPVGIDRVTRNKATSWDDFELRLRSMLSSAITPAPDPWIRIERRPLGDLDIALVTVQVPNTWFWASGAKEPDAFYVRYGNATRPLNGPAMVHHMRSMPRDD